MPRRTFDWRGESYRLEGSTWHFWGGARLIQLPGQDAQYRLAPDPTLFIRFATEAGYALPEDLDGAAQLSACQAYLEQHGHHVWRVQDALQIVRDEADTDLATRLLGCLIDWFFISKV
jgi:hypothetical protein